MLERTGCGDSGSARTTEIVLEARASIEGLGGGVASYRSKLLPQRLERDAIKFRWSSPVEVLNPKLHLTWRAKEDTNVI